jgi:hypothetical protein
MNTYTESKLDTFLSLEMGIQVSHGSKDIQACPYCSVCVIFMSVGIAKIDEETISEQLSDMSIVTLDNVGTHPLICTHHIPVLFGVELGGETSGIDQVTEHDRELTTFGFWYARFGWQRDTLRWLIVLDRRLWLSWDRWRS